ncbi:MAG: hypothetical protein WCJ64_10320 [Rhodospirillaceae bacterium]
MTAPSRMLDIQTNGRRAAAIPRYLRDRSGNRLLPRKCRLAATIAAATKFSQTISAFFLSLIRRFGLTWGERASRLPLPERRIARGCVWYAISARGADGAPGQRRTMRRGS